MIDQVYPVILEPKLSIDRVTLLMQTGPLLGLASCADRDYFEKKKLAIRNFINGLKTAFPDCFDLKSPCSDKTDLYLYHFRLVGGVDLQMCPKFGIKNRISDMGYIECFGTDSEKEFAEENGFIDEYFDSDYCIRIEYNPNKDDISICAPLFKYLASKFTETTFDYFLKLSRFDLAVDYPEILNPALFSCKRSRKTGWVGGGEGVETLYFGTRRSAWHWRIYDKKRELKEVQKIDYNGASLWRIELESKPGLSIGEDMHFYTQLFRRLNIYYGKSTGQYKFDWFLHYAKCFGFQNALKTIEDIKTQKKYSEFFSALDFDSFKHPASIVGWQFPKLWKSYYDSLRVLFGRENDPYIFARNERETM